VADGPRHRQRGAGLRTDPNVINSFSDVILDMYGPEVGQHARPAAGLAALPLNNAVVIAAEVEVAE
jgi:hypothetical protein